jgi:hypothetical protein
MACNNRQPNDRVTLKDTTNTSTPSIEKAIPIYTGPRYEIIQSTLAAKGTFRLDTYSGDVCQLQSDGNKSEAWFKLRRIPAIMQGVDSTIEGRSNYHLFLSTIAMRFTYLINVNTGATWELVEDQQTREDYFSPIFDR